MSEAKGGLAQLARALALQAKGHRFESDILHQKKFFKWNFFYVRAKVQMASPVVSLTSTFSSILNKAYKSATQRKLNSCTSVGLIKNKM